MMMSAVKLKTVLLQAVSPSNSHLIYNLQLVKK